MWIRLNLLALRELFQLSRSQYALVKYNDLIENPEAAFEGLFDFLKLNPKHKQIEKQNASKLTSFKNTTTTGNPLEKWKTNLSEVEKTTVDTVIKEYKSDYTEITNTIEQMKVKL